MGVRMSYIGQDWLRWARCCAQEWRNPQNAARTRSFGYRSTESGGRMPAFHGRRDARRSDAVPAVVREWQIFALICGYLRLIALNLVIFFYGYPQIIRIASSLLRAPHVKRCHLLLRYFLLF